ncbi:sensor histidine kinase [Roseivirga misakiensis]|uniref:Two component system, sensor protein n=1 Tax=Roseivirga misakiensis TaxID=1563681 RepID=A0A1E5T030_9BACT|nr:histidine kinase [Roseivirga misakiensis]OEK04716.1 two component system, sensor protein [Roseivirga misakiensis]
MPKINFERLMFDTPRLMWHVIFWLIYTSFFAIVYGSFEEDYSRQFQHVWLDAIVQIPAVYLVLYVLMPKLLFKGKYGQFFGWLLLIILVFSGLNWFVYVLVQKPLLWPDDPYQPILWNVGKIFKTTAKIYPVVVLAIVSKWFKYWYREEKNNRLLSEEKLQAELKFLKAQIHPHFLFNTLNNLYALTLKSSKEAPEVVLKLSDLLNYMLYECSADSVSLEKEVRLVKDYIALEKIRYGDRLEVNFNCAQHIGDVMLAPLMILPFVENAFKHGVSEELDQSWVAIDLNRKGEQLTLKVENSKSIQHKEEDHFEYKKGIGLKNVKRRLEILYGDDYQLDIHESEESFLVVLKLNFKGH